MSIEVTYGCACSFPSSGSLSIIYSSLRGGPARGAWLPLDPRPDSGGPAPPPLHWDGGRECRLGVHRGRGAVPCAQGALPLDLGSEKLSDPGHLETSLCSRLAWGERGPLLDPPAGSSARPLPDAQASRSDGRAPATLPGPPSHSCAPALLSPRGRTPSPPVPGHCMGRWPHITVPWLHQACQVQEVGGSVW